MAKNDEPKAPKGMKFLGYRTTNGFNYPSPDKKGTEIRYEAGVEIDRDTVPVNVWEKLNKAELVAPEFGEVKKKNDS